MKAKKALKRLTRVEELLAGVLDGLAAIEQHARELLDSAKASVVRAKKEMKQKTAPAEAKKRSVERKRLIRTGPAMEARKKARSPRKEARVPAKAARTAAKKPSVKVRKPKRARLVAESKKRPALAAKKRPAKVRRAIQARNVQPHPAESTSPMPSFSSTLERQSDTTETNTAPSRD